MITIIIRIIILEPSLSLSIYSMPFGSHMWHGMKNHFSLLIENSELWNAIITTNWDWAEGKSNLKPFQGDLLS